MSGVAMRMEKEKRSVDSAVQSVNRSVRQESYAKIPVRLREGMKQHIWDVLDGERTVPISLSDSMRTRMESRLGPAISSVRLVQSDLPQRLGVDALAQGDLIRFAPGAFSPTTRSGEQLLAHELAHTVQQGRGDGMGGTPGMPAYDPATERAADVMAQQAMDGGIPLRAAAVSPASRAPMLGGKLFGGIVNRFKKLLSRNAQQGTREDEQELLADWRAQEQEWEKIVDMEQRLALRPWKISNRQDKGGNYDIVRVALQQFLQTGSAKGALVLPEIDEPETVIPVKDSQLEENYDALSNAKSVDQLTSIFGTQVLKQNSFRSNLPKNVELEKLKNRLIPMTRVIRDFPRLKEHVGNFVANKDDKAIMSCDIAFGKNKSNINWNTNYVSNSKEYSEKVFKSWFKNFSVNSAAYDGVHELGHVINMALSSESKTLAPEKDYYDSVTINGIFNRALKRISNSKKNNETGYSWVHWFLFKHGDINGDVDLTDQEAREELCNEKQTSKYGGSKPRELFAEAFSDVYENGDKASTLNKKIVKEAWLLFNGDAAQYHKALKAQRSEEQAVTPE